MIVNKKRLEELISGAIIYCENCPIYEDGDWTICDKYPRKAEDTFSKNCEETLLDWLQEFDIVEALEEGAHIINDQVVFPPLPLPNDFKLNALCDSDEMLCDSSCPWFNKCPFEDD